MTARIVVGVDGSSSSLRALDAAIEQAHWRDATVDVVHTWQRPLQYGPPDGALLISSSEVERAARSVLRRAVARAPRDVELHEVLVEGHAARTLVDAARGADLLVVGSRGHGGFTGLLLGSTGIHVATHAMCPVLIVPPDRQAAGA